jgi:hypothetical protein
MSFSRITMAGRRMAAATSLMILAILATNTIYWITASTWPEVAQAFSAPGAVAQTGVAVATLPVWQVAGALVISTLPLLLLCGALVELRMLFRFYAGGEFFPVAAPTHLRRVARRVAAWAVVQVLSDSALSLWLTFQLPAGERQISLLVGAWFVVALFVAGCIGVIAHILSRAADLYKGNSRTGGAVSMGNAM